MVRRFLPNLLWIATAAIVTALLLRFGMRVAGARDDTPFAGMVYALTAPLVAPFYGYFPAAARFDYPAIEWASLVAAGVVVALGLGVYMLGLLMAEKRASKAA